MGEVVMVLGCLAVGAWLVAVGLVLRAGARRIAPPVPDKWEPSPARLASDAARLDVCRVPGETDAEIVEALVGEGHYHRRSQA